MQPFDKIEHNSGHKDFSDQEGEVYFGQEDEFLPKKRESRNSLYDQKELLSHPSEPNLLETETEHGEDGHHHRERFNSYFEYMMTVLGFAAGFGSLWRFPYLVYKNGGGAFLIPYIVLLIVVGIPAFYMESALGQMYQKGPSQIFGKFGKRYKGLGYLQSFIAFNEATYYNLILAYSIYYFWESFSFPLPWKVDWNTHPEPWNREYFYDDVLKSSGCINIFGSLVVPIFVCYVISQLIVYLCIQKGVSVSGKIALFTATSPYVLLIILMIRGFFLDGASDGLAYLLTPDLSKLFDLDVWADAAAQIIFQFSCGISVLVFFGSYRDQKSELHKSSILIPFLTCLCGFLSAFAVFSYMGYMSKLSGIPIQDLPLKGPDLTFIAYPAVLSMMPFANLWAIVFFAVMIFLGIDTQFGFMDGLAGAIEDEYATPKGVKIFGRYFSMRVVRFFLCAGVMLTGLLYASQAGFYYLEFVDFYTTAVPSLVSVGIETHFFTHKQDWKTLELKIIRHVKIPTPTIYINLLKYVIPTVCIGLSIASFYKQITKLNDHAWYVTMFGWFISLYPFAVALHIYKKYKQSDMDKEFEKQQQQYEQKQSNYQEYA